MCLGVPCTIKGVQLCLYIRGQEQRAGGEARGGDWREGEGGGGGGGQEERQQEPQQGERGRRHQGGGGEAEEGRGKRPGQTQLQVRLWWL